MSHIRHLRRERDIIEQEYQEYLSKLERYSIVIARHNPADVGMLSQLEKEKLEIKKKCEKLAEQLEELDARLNSDYLHSSLLKLDYQEQVHAFRVFVESGFPVGAFLIHGAPHHGQTWLLTRLVRQYFQHCTTAEKIRIDLSRHGRRKGIDSLWRDLSSKVGLHPTATPQDVGTRVVEWCKDRHVILIFDEINEIEPYFEEFITGFWLYLATTAQDFMPSTSDFRLIMFLVDSCGALSSHHAICDNHLEPQWEPHIPVRLPSIVQLSADALLQWIQHESDTLPLDLISRPEQTVQDILQNSESGIPQLVLEQICELCGCDWYESEQIWLKI
jgi:hypothetical protein